MAATVTVKDIAQRAEVSIGTVSRVFNQHQNVTTEVRQRVLQAAESLGYTGHAGRRTAATPVATPRFREIGFLFSLVNEGTVAAANPFWSQILAGVERESSQAELKLSYRAIGDLRHTPERLQAVVAAMELDGLLLVGPAERQEVEALRALGLPLVLVAFHEPQLGIDTVLEHNYEGMREAIRFLLGQGHRSIGFIGGPSSGGPRPVNTLYPLELRLDAYRAALSAAELPVDYKLYEGSNLTPEGGYAACQRLLARGAQFSALVCANDSTAVGATRALREAGLRIPGDVSLMGFGGYLHAAEQMSPALTTIFFDNAQLGRLAVQRLRARATDPHGPTLSTLLNGQLVVRDSVRSLV